MSSALVLNLNISFVTTFGTDVTSKQGSFKIISNEQKNCFNEYLSGKTFKFKKAI